jgi:hypothetical protein
MSGYDGIRAEVLDWYCVYDLVDRKVSLDLALMNRDTIRLSR